MHKRLRIVARTAAVLAAMSVPLGAAPLAAHASVTVSTCQGTTSWRYSPSLGTGTTFGTIAQTYTQECPEAYYQDGFGTPRVGEDVGGGTWNFSVGYSGNCALANFNFYVGGSGLLIGGSVAVVVTPNPYYDVSEIVEVDAMAPLLAPCLESSSLGTSSDFFVGEY